jgi:hypothetical protein
MIMVTPVLIGVRVAALQIQAHPTQGKLVERAIEKMQLCGSWFRWG